MASSPTHVSETEMGDDFDSPQTFELQSFRLEILGRLESLQSCQQEILKNESALLSKIERVKTLFNTQLKDIRDKLDWLYFTSDHVDHVDWRSCHATIGSSPQRYPSQEVDLEGLPVVMGPGFLVSWDGATETTGRPCIPEGGPAFRESPFVQEDQTFREGGPTFSETPFNQDGRTVITEEPLEIQTQHSSSPVPVSPTSEANSLYLVTQRPGGLGMAMAYHNQQSDDLDDI
ncbi:hypothetical protein K435DRAFT_856217 [Dendrothele bispora CBS 962.96]|uniref:Uncharacterized protein n=1 Tax=Dendrothele bispora (strain CBS 962.96) TaxID=1314807 RepID=A0A4S8M916_DENBC|nr:hypothetical protein K435DRAFT_856217 [Dendrothele bispora CBS 962.96]